MADPFVAEVRIFPFNFPPVGWAFCDGQLMPLSQNTALFALLGTVYGGDGKSNFALPDFQGSSVRHAGTDNATGETTASGETGGAESITLLVSEMPVHNHTLSVSSEVAVAKAPTGLYAARGAGVGLYAPNNAGQTFMSPAALAPAGGGLPHNNMQPYVTLSYCIALQGVFPQRP